MSNQVSESVESKGPTCAICGKPLSDEQSLERGIGPLCWARQESGVDLGAHYQEITIEQAPEGWIKLSEVAKTLSENHLVPVARLLKACGGDRALDPVLHERYQVLYVGKTRYLSPEVLSPASIEFLSNLGRKPKKEKSEKTAKTKRQRKSKDTESEQTG